MKKIFNKEYICIIGFAVIVGLLYISGVGCPVKFITGVSCPGCGMTRAVYSLMRLDFAAAFHYHPLVIMLPVIVLLLAFQWKMDRKVFNGLMTAIIIIFLAVYIVRMINPNDTVVVFGIRDNIFSRIIRKLCLKFS
ncbi:MAG: DUF2752 domain-containing protein [Eubacteriales bacterium]|nr:DUF2752 domain-containing protein [Eubacteriales bacterium]